MGPDDVVSVGEEVGNSACLGPRTKLGRFRSNSYVYLAVLLFAAAIYLAGIISPPRLMDDVDAVQAQIARNMLSSGDWVTARLDGVIYMEKAPLIYWLIACSYKIFGVHDWVARIPVALSAISLAWLTTAFGIWAFGRRAGFYAGLCISTCVGLFLFTRIQIPDVTQTLTIALALWAFMRVLDEKEKRPRLWAAILAASLGVGLLLKGLIGVVFPAGAALIYLLLTHQLFVKGTWRKLRPFSGALIILAIAAPWHILATLRNPPYFEFTLHSIPGQYHGFLWFYFINEQLLRFLNLRYPRDYNTVPRLWFWVLHFVWLFPWSVYLPGTLRLQYRAPGRASRTRLLALSWIGFVLVFFTFSTTQEYYSMPCYPAFALLIGSAMACNNSGVRRGSRVLSVLSGLAAIAAFAIWFSVRNLPTPGDISDALSRNPSVYTLSMGHLFDLTLSAFAYLRLPLLIAAGAFLLGSLANVKPLPRRAFVGSALMMVFFFQAARMALVAFDPYMGSYGLAQTLLHSSPGTLIVDHNYYDYSSVFFYTGRPGFLLNARRMNLLYGSYAPGAPNVFIDDTQWRQMWLAPQRRYLLISEQNFPRLEPLVAKNRLYVVKESGGKLLVTNQRLPDHP